MIQSQYRGLIHKVPLHVAFIIDMSQIYSGMMQDVANLICWSFSFGIRFVTVYDVDGFFKNNEDLLTVNLSRKVNSFF